MTLLRESFFAAADLDARQTWKLLDWCQARGADEFTLRMLGLEGRDTPHNDKVESELQPFALPAAVREHPIVYAGEDSPRLTPLWRLTPDSIRVLRIRYTDGLFTYPVGEWEVGCIEDPVVYRNGEILLGIVTHEREGLLRLTDAEQAEVAAMGIPTRSRPEWI